MIKAEALGFVLKKKQSKSILLFLMFAVLASGAGAMIIIRGGGCNGRLSKHVIFGGEKLQGGSDQRTGVRWMLGRFTPKIYTMPLLFEMFL